LRLLFLLILAGVGAYFTVPTREAHEAAARAYLEAQAQADVSAAQQAQADNAAAGGAPFSLDSVVDFVTGMMAGQGRYESFYLASRYSLDMPGTSYLECFGAYTLVRCTEQGGASG